MRPLLLAVALVLFALTASAAQYPPEYRWRTITTGNFYIHYHQGEEELARRAAAIAEQAHERVTALLQSKPTGGRTHLVLTDNVDVSNGSATPLPFNRIEIYVSAPGADPSSPLEHYDDWLNLVITHEYAHIVHLDQVRGFWRGVRNVFGRTIFTVPNALAPEWMVEGIATVAESEETEAGRLKGTFIDMVLRTAAIENRFATEPQASGLTEDWPAGNARYYYGASFLSWLARTRGADKLAQYFHDYSGNVIPLRPNASARAVYDTSLRALWREWSDQAQRDYRVQHESLRSAGLTARDVLTTHGYETKYPMLSPDATRIAYAHRGAYAWPMLRVHDVASRREVAALKINNSGPVSWSPDGRSIAFSQLEYERTHSLLSDVYVWEVGGTVRRVTRGARLKSPAFMPDGTALVAVENRAGRNRIVRVDAATGATTVLVDPGDFTQYSDPHVSPDGSRLAVAEWNRGRIDVVTYDLQGRRLANLTESLPRAVNATPRFSRDGATIWFSSDVTGVPNIYSVASNGGAIARRTNVYGGAFFPTTADGVTIYYADYSSRGFDLARLDAGTALPVEPRVIAPSVIGRTDRVAATLPEPVTNAADTPYSPRHSIWPRWWAPIFSGASSEGGGSELTVGASTSGGDALGFHEYDLQLAVTTRSGADDDDESSTQVDYGIVYSYDRLYPTLTVASSRFTEQTDVGVRTGDFVRWVDQRVGRTVAQATFPFRRYRWQSSATIGAVHETYDPEDIPGFEGPLGEAGIFDGSLTGGRAALMFNTAREFSGSISPENGMTARLDAEVLGGAREIQQLRADTRGYLSLFGGGTRARHVLAARVAGGWSGGDRVIERDMKVGGISSGEPLIFGVNDFPVRGFANSTLRGRNAALVSLEYRLPLFDIDRGPSTWPVFFHRMVAAAFYDTATAWNDDGHAFDTGNTISSVGAEVGLDLFLGYLVPMRMRLGVAVPLATVRPSDEGAEIYLTVGRSF